MDKDNLSQETSDVTNGQQEQENTSDKSNAPDNVTEATDNSFEEKYNALNEAHLRLRAEFDNYRKRTLKEKADLIRNGSETTLTSLLPIVDDFERAVANFQKTDQIEVVEEGVKLIYTKFITYLSQQGVKPMDAIGKPFDTDMFEAVATIPAPEEKQKGKVLDCIQTGYTLNDKVIRHAKVVVGE